MSIASILAAVDLQWQKVLRKQWHRENRSVTLPKPYNPRLFIPPGGSRISLFTDCLKVGPQTLTNWIANWLTKPCSPVVDSRWKAAVGFALMKTAFSCTGKISSG
jgi:hypothetical protein